MFCIHDGAKMREIGISGRDGYQCPYCKQVQIMHTHAMIEGEPWRNPAVFLYATVLAAAGQIPQVFQESLFPEK